MNTADRRNLRHGILLWFIALAFLFAGFCHRAEAQRPATQAELLAVIAIAHDEGMDWAHAGWYAELAEHEGYSDRPYLDVAGVRTVCFGETQGVEDRVYTLDECTMMLLRRGHDDFMEPLALCTVGWERLPFEVREAVFLFAYNVGIAAYCHSTMHQLLQAYVRTGDPERGLRACAELRRWNHSGGHVVRGLTLRRQHEEEICRAGFGGANRGGE